jgi:hypothetical protein
VGLYTWSLKTLSWLFFALESPGGALHSSASSVITRCRRWISGARIPERRVRAGVGVKGDIVIGWMWRQHVYVIQSSKDIRTRGVKVSNNPSTNSHPEIVATPRPKDLTSRSLCLMRSMGVLPARVRKKAPMNGRIKVFRTGTRRRIRRTTERRSAKTVVLSVNKRIERKTAEMSAVGSRVARVSRCSYFKSSVNMQTSVRRMELTGAAVTHQRTASQSQRAFLVV